MESLELKKTLKEIGKAIHSMNTIAVALSKLNEENCSVPNGLDISWSPADLENSKKIARNYFERASIIYSVESFFEYIDSISKNPFWLHKNIHFKGDEKKSERVSSFLNHIPDIPEEVQILCELACHWRNKIVHANSSNAKLSSRKIDILKEKRNFIIENYYHFDIDIALKNFEENKITLKDSSTFITMLLKSVRLIDSFFFENLSLLTSQEKLIEELNKKDDFIKIKKEQPSKKRDRQLSTYIKMTYPFLEKEIFDKLITIIKPCR